MNLWIMSFIGGLIGSVFMDIAEHYMAKSGITSGVKGIHIGRWVHGLLSGKIYHPDIETTAPVNNEAHIAIVFHYLAGGGAVALAYPAFLTFFDKTHLAWQIPLPVLFGLITCILPWFILMPFLGKGVFGKKMPEQASPIIAPILSHLVYGLGIGITLVSI